MARDARLRELVDRIRAVRAAETVCPRRGRGQRRHDAAVPEGIARVASTDHATNGHRDESLEPVLGVFQIDYRLTTTAITAVTGLDGSAVKNALDSGQVRIRGRARGTTYEWSP